MEGNNADSNDEPGKIHLVALNDEASSAVRRKLYLAALNGDWKSVRNMDNIQKIITNKGETTLHIAAAAKQEDFVKNLVKKYEHRDLAAGNNLNSTVLTYAAATGNVNIARAMLSGNSSLANIDKVKPLIMAASLGHIKMVEYLYNQIGQWPDNERAKLDQAELFITCVEGNLYGIAKEMLTANNNLAKTRTTKGKTVLYVLARNPSAFVSDTRPWLKCKQENSKHASELFKKCLQEYRGGVGNSPDIREVLFVAAEEGNIECLIMLIRFEFDLLWETTTQRESIFHFAAKKRHENIFYLLNEIGSIGDFIIDGTVEADGNNILHLAAELAPKEKLNAISGAALQMQREMSWFKEVEKIVPPVFKEKKNRKDETPYDVFARTHEELRTKGEKWMIDTANYSMVVATLIGSTMFSGLIADGLDRSSKHYFVFSVASAISLFSSSTSLVMFLSILTSRYSYNDFVLWLPLRLLIGIASLCISIAAMMVAFFTSFMLTNHNGKELPVIFAVIGLFAFAPIIYGLLKWYLFVDIARSTFFRFKPRQRLLYKEVSHDHEPESSAIESRTHCVNLACIK